MIPYRPVREAPLPRCLVMHASDMHFHKLKRTYVFVRARRALEELWMWPGEYGDLPWPVDALWSHHLSL